jgi:hypothetical protein
LTFNLTAARRPNMSVDRPSTIPVIYFEFHKAPYKSLDSEAFLQNCAFAEAAPTTRRGSFVVEVPSGMRTREDGDVGNKGGLPLESGRVQASAVPLTIQMV